MKSLKKIIIVLLIIIILIMLLILKFLNQNKKQEILNEFASNENNADTIKLDDKIKEVDNASLYYSVMNCLNKYMEIINWKENGLEEFVEGGEILLSDLYGISTKENQYENIYNLLSQNYIEKNNINMSNVSSIINMYKCEVYNITRMYIKDDETIKIFFVYLKINDKDALIKISLNVESNCFSVEPLEYVSEEELKNSYIDSENVEKNQYNSFRTEQISDEEMAKKYFNNYKHLLLKNNSDAYELLNENYKQVRFNNYSKFNKYINDNKQKLSKIKITKYSIKTDNNYKEYICKDQYNNIYIFEEKAIMNYSVILDTYTLENEVFNKEYGNATEEKKVQMNIDKIIQMVNRYDYDTLYKYLSKGFKSNYFENQEQFENYIKSKMFTYNKFKFIEFSKKGSNIFTYKIQLSDLTGEDTSIKEMTIIMKINDGTDFEFSFEV